MSDNNVVILDCITKLDVPVDRVLESAKDQLDHAVILGWDKDGEMYFASTISDGSEVLWLMEKAKLNLLTIFTNET